MRKVAVLGTWRAAPASDLYRDAETIGRIAAVHGYAVITGAYSGVMEAAAKGARLAKGHTIGYSWSRLSQELSPNSFLDEIVEFDSPGIRIARLVEDADICVFLPGRTGTLAELALATELRAKGQKTSPLVLYGHFWTGFFDWLRISNEKLPLQRDSVSPQFYVMASTPPEVEAVFARK